MSVAYVRRDVFPTTAQFVEYTHVRRTRIQGIAVEKRHRTSTCVCVSVRFVIPPSTSSIIIVLNKLFSTYFLLLSLQNIFSLFFCPVSLSLSPSPSTSASFLFCIYIYTVFLLSRPVSCFFFVQSLNRYRSSVPIF